MATNEKSCLVLGGHGFVGQAVVAVAKAKGYHVTAVSRDNYESVKGATCDVLVNANGNSRKFLARENPPADFQASVESVLHSLMDFKTDRYIFLSSIDVYSNVRDPEANRESTSIDPSQLSPYGLHKFMAEQLVRYYQPEAVILRMGGFVGPGLWKNPIFDLITGQQLRVHPDSAYQYMPTAELARIVFELIETNMRSECFNVAGSGTVRIREIAEMIPDCALSDQGDWSDPEHYEINTDKLSALTVLPESRYSVERFISDVVSGRIPIGKSAAT